MSQTCCVALELSRSKWLIGSLAPSTTRVVTHAVPGGDVVGLLRVLDRVALQAKHQTGDEVTVEVCYEAGYDGFWLARWLLARGIRTHVLDAASFLVSRRGRRAKTDRIDVEAMALTLRAFLAGDGGVCREVAVPTPEAEDAKRLARERVQLVSERTRHVNRIRGLLALHGIREVKGLWGGDWTAALGEIRTGDGRLLGPYLRAEISREFERLHLVMRHMKQLEADRHVAVTADASPFPEQPKVAQLVRLAGIGELSATALVAEVFHRRFDSRRHLASYLGLAPSPYSSGDTERDQGISKAGNRGARVLLVELAWCWLRHQPASELAAWYRRAFAERGARTRKVGIVALARKLAIALWRFVEAGVVPQGAVVNTH